MSFSGKIHWRIFRSIGADTLGQILNAGSRLIIIPVFLSAWGSDLYGEWLILTAITAWFSLGDLGGQLYFGNKLTQAWAAGEVSLFQRVYSTGMVLFLTYSIAMLLVMIALIYIVPINSIFNLSKVTENTAKLVLLIMAIKFVVAFPVGLMLGLYRAIGCQATSIMYANLMMAFQFLLTLIALISGLSFEVLAGIEVLPYLVAIPFILNDFPKRVGNNFSLYKLRAFSREIYMSSIFPSIHFLVIQLSMAFSIQGSIVILAKVLSPVDVAIYSSMRVIANIMSRFFGMVSHATLPDVTRLMELKNFQLLIKLFNLTTLVTILFGATFTCFVNYYGEWTYIKWLSHKLPYDNMVMFVLTFQAVVNCIWSLGGNMLMAINHHKQYAFSQVIANGLALVLCYFSASEYGLLGGVLTITFCQSGIMVPVVYKYTKKFISKEIATNYIISVLSAICLLSIILVPYLLPFFWLAIFLLLARILSLSNTALSKA